MMTHCVVTRFFRVRTEKLILLKTINSETS